MEPSTHVKIAEGVSLPRAQPGDQPYSLLEKLGQAEEIILHLELRKKCFQPGEHDHLKEELTHADVTIISGLDTRVRGHPPLPTTIIAPAKKDFQFTFEYYRSPTPNLPVESISSSLEGFLPRGVEGLSPGCLLSIILPDRQKYVIHGTGDYIPTFIENLTDYGREKAAVMVVPFSVYQQQREKMVRYIAVMGERDDETVQAAIKNIFGDCDTCNYVPLETLKEKLRERFRQDLVVEVPNQHQRGEKEGVVYSREPEITSKKVRFRPIL